MAQQQGGELSEVATDRFRDAYAEDLQSRLRTILDRACANLIIKVRGDESHPAPTVELAAQEACHLIEFLRMTPSQDLSASVRVAGWVAVCNALANVEGRAKEARALLRAAIDLVRYFPSDCEESRSVLRIDAKLLYLEGRRREAYSQLIGQNDPKAINLLLRLMVDEGRVDDALKVVQKNEPHLDWSEVALLILGEVHDLEGLERLHGQFAVECQRSGKKLKAIELNVALSEAYFAHGLRLIKGVHGDKVFVTQLTPDATTAFERSLSLAKVIAEQPASTGENRAAVQATFSCMKCCGLLGDFEGAANYALRLPADYRILKEVVGALINRLVKPSAIYGENR